MMTKTIMNKIVGGGNVLKIPLATCFVIQKKIYIHLLSYLIKNDHTLVYDTNIP